MLLTSLICTALLAWTPCVLAKKTEKAILLSKVKSLTLRDGLETSHRRVKPLPQLNCVGGNACGLYNVDVMRCTNSGSEYDAEDIQWTCKAELPPEFKLGSTEVICEGYDNADDPYILKGSCGVEYRLVLTELGEQKYRHLGTHRASRTGREGIYDGVRGVGGYSLASILFWTAFIAIALFFIYKIFSSNSDRTARGFTNGFRGGHGGGGGGGDDGYDDPPPPYTPRAAPKSKNTSSSRASTSRSSNSAQNQPWRPGFWTGTAAGAAAGYGAATWNANRQQRSQQTQNYGAPSSIFGQGRSPSYNSPSSYGYGAGPSSSGFGSSSTPSSSRHESTGFGGTRRR